MKPLLNKAGKRRQDSNAFEVEPNFEKACEWWADMSGIWTPIGWKNHMFRFNVFWNGTLIACPDMNRRTEKWKDLGVQLSFVPGTSWEKLSCYIAPHQIVDDGMVLQGWNNSPTPVLWSEYRYEGVLLRQEVFAHIPGGKDIVSGIEPLFAWMRLSVHATCAGMPLEDKYGFLIHLSAPQAKSGDMNLRSNVHFRIEGTSCLRELSAEKEEYDRKQGFRILENDGNVRLGIAARQNCRAFFRNGLPLDSSRTALYVEMDAVRGEHADLLIPMLPTERNIFDRELSLGYDASLRQANRYWAKTPKTAAVINVPEEFINQAIRYNMKMVEVIAERNPADGNYSVITGSFSYTNLWPTPGAFTLSTFMDEMGYFKEVERYLEIFLRMQGTVVPPGDSFSLHHGYLSSPKSLTSIDWLSDHGALLWAISRHALLSGDKAFLEKWLEPILKACEFIRYARNLKNHTGISGIMPPATATDLGTKIQAVWNDGWNYKGLVTAVRVLKKAGHPRAEEFIKEAESYRQAFQKAFRKKTLDMPTWKDRQGHTHHLTPTSLYGDEKAETRNAFYLDTGPLFLVFAGLMDVRDPLMKSTLKWFREGPQTEFYRRDSGFRQVPCLDHEISSCEPGYSWNIFHSHRSGDREKFLEGMYSLFAGALSRKTFTPCETRGGVFGLTPAQPLVHFLRLAVIDDEIFENELHLLRLMPLAWLKPGDECKFEKIPTEFGSVTLLTSMSKDRKTLKVIFRPSYRESPAKVVLHIPPDPELKTIIFNNKNIRADKKTFEI